MINEKTQGKRVYDVEPHCLKECEYGKWSFDHNWYASSPGGHLAALTKHKVVEHEDRTITVSPSILISTTRWNENSQKMERVQRWHGYLEKGIWREC